ncbi:sulfatase-like hydrolase/transferase [Pedobacter sandarakinus]|uniref:sulfatase-like hydrolase/transferase n=1 Tax=Pedobacter sandarakinus TaxID=353156 RepID=UPI002245ACB7|nr:sulfatase-like hydrolase/transferase [Pedobacter sandarakinus]MCX2575887.1 sulfatase-like hydrolase/transferase [Pedobacter sandarakinus]
MRNISSLFILCLLLISHVGFTQEKQPNIIIILVDDMGFSDVTTFGGKFVPTPNIDRLAKNGLMLNQYYSGAPICSPSRTSLLTGMYPGRWNFSTYLDNRQHNKNAEQADFLDPNAPSIARVFQSAGYATGHFGKWHMGGGRDVKNAPGFEKYGYDAHASTYESPDPDPLLTATNWIWSDKDSIKRWDRTKYFVDKTLNFFKQNKNKPRFVNLWPDDVHTPWVPNVGEEYTGNFPMGQESEQAFKLVLKELDVQVGRLIDGLKEMGEDKNTIIIFTSDNGPLPSFKGSRTGGLRGSKLSLYEGGTRMPFLICWPGHIPQGKVDATSEVNAIDLLPSLAKMAAVKLPSAYKGDGIDRSKVFTGSASLRGKNMFWEYGRNNIAFKYPAGPNKSPNLAVRAGEWKLLMNNDGSDVQLYNIVKDKNETTDLSTQETKITNKLKTELSAWWESLPKLKN